MRNVSQNVLHAIPSWFQSHRHKKPGNRYNSVPSSFDSPLVPCEFPSNSSSRILEKGTPSRPCPVRICPSVKHMPVGRDTSCNLASIYTPRKRPVTPRMPRHRDDNPRGERFPNLVPTTIVWLRSDAWRYVALGHRRKTKLLLLFLFFFCNGRNILQLQSFQIFEI